MKKEVAKALQHKAQEIQAKYSNKDRTNNFNNETFKIKDIKPISAMSAYVIFEKNTGKRALAHFIYVDMPNKPYWTYYFMRTDHMLNLNVLVDKYLEVEQHNFPINFGNKPIEQYEIIPDVLQPIPKQI